MDLWIPTSFALAGISAIAAHLRATRAVRASDRRQRRRAEAYLEIAEVLIVALDVHGRVQMANRKACETLGRREDELLGADWLAIAVPPRERELGRSAFAWLLGGDVEFVRDYEMAVLCADGSTRLVEWHHALRHDENGDLLGTLSSAWTSPSAAPPSAGSPASSATSPGCAGSPRRSPRRRMPATPSCARSPS